MVCDSGINILKHESNKKTLSWEKMLHAHIEMAVVNKMAHID